MHNVTFFAFAKIWQSKAQVRAPRLHNEQPGRCAGVGRSRGATVRGGPAAPPPLPRSNRSMGIGADTRLALAACEKRPAVATGGWGGAGAGDGADREPGAGE